MKTTIEWTESTWNPVTGCTRISPGCQHCYAERMSRRLRAMGQERYRNGFRVTTHPDVLDLPLSWRKPQVIFVNSMSDLFHEKVPAEFIQRIFAVMGQAEHHVFQILTKRADRLAELAGQLTWAPNIWMGVTVEMQAYASRIEQLRTVPAAVRFLSVEPLLGPIMDLPLDGIHWVIAGGESGPNARPMHLDWARAVRDQCRAAGVPFFFKQWGGVRRKEAGRVLDGRTWDEYPRNAGQRLGA